MTPKTQATKRNRLPAAAGSRCKRSRCLTGRLGFPVARFWLRTRRKCIGCCDRPIRKAAACRISRTGGRNFPAIPSSTQRFASLVFSERRLAGAALCWTSAFLKDLAVRPDMRRLGIGENLLRQVFRHFRVRGAAAVDLKVETGNANASGSTSAPACTAFRTTVDRRERISCRLDSSRCASARISKERSRALWSKICAVTISSSAPVRRMKASRPLLTVAGEPTMAQDSAWSSIDLAIGSSAAS